MKFSAEKNIKYDEEKILNVSLDSTLRITDLDKYTDHSLNLRDGLSVMFGLKTHFSHCHVSSSSVKHYLRVRNLTCLCLSLQGHHVHLQGTSTRNVRRPRSSRHDQGNGPGPLCYRGSEGWSECLSLPRVLSSFPCRSTP